MNMSTRNILLRQVQGYKLTIPGLNLPGIIYSQIPSIKYYMEQENKTTGDKALPGYLAPVVKHQGYSSECIRTAYQAIRSNSTEHAGAA